jgi:peptidyl-Lys metalloendopeptidase
MFKHKFGMFSLLLVVLFAFVSVTGAGAAPKGDAVVTLSVDQTSFTASENVVIHVLIENTGKNPVKVLKWYTPAEDVEEPLFAVTRNGAAVDYTGAHYKRPAATGSDYVVLKSGESFTRDVDLGAYYDLTASGDYSITYDVGSWNLFSEKGSDKKAVETLSSNTLTLSIAGRTSSARSSSNMVSYGAAVTGGSTFNKCTTAQQATVTTARNDASNYAAAALSYLNTKASSQPTLRYTTWFGTYLNTRYSTVTSHFSALNTTLSTASMTFDCGCKKKYYAYVYPTQPYTVYLCSVFWTAPATGTDSKAGTLVHETSHFNVVASTDDWAYGQTNAKNLAISDPAKAIDNADSHEYFAENTPVQP